MGATKRSISSSLSKSSGHGWGDPRAHSMGDDPPGLPRACRRPAAGLPQATRRRAEGFVIDQGRKEVGWKFECEGALNIFHSLKITPSLGPSRHEVPRRARHQFSVVLDSIPSSSGLREGFSFSGACLLKVCRGIGDVRGLTGSAPCAS